jgi:hypothetical protein
MGLKIGDRAKRADGARGRKLIVPPARLGAELVGLWIVCQGRIG